MLHTKERFKEMATISIKEIPKEANSLRCLDLRQTASLLGLSYRKLSNMVAANELPTVRFGKRVAIRLSSLEAYLDSAG